MARIRSIKPEFPQSESMGKVSREARLCFILLWTLSDDAGRLRGNSRMLASLLYPYDDDANQHIESWLSELEKQDCIARYKINSDSYLQISKWTEHQKIDKPSPSKIPEPSASIRDDSREVASIRDDSSRKGREGKGEERIKERKGEEAAFAAMFPDVDPQVVADFKTLRAKKKAPITPTAIDGIRTEALKAGISMQEALAICCRKGWTGFDATWNWRSGAGPPGQSKDEKAAQFIGELTGKNRSGHSGNIIDVTPDRAADAVD